MGPRIIVFKPSARVGRCGLSSELLKLEQGVGGAVSGVHRLDCLWLHRRFPQGVFLDPRSLGFSEDVLDMLALLAAYNFLLQHLSTQLRLHLGNWLLCFRWTGRPYMTKDATQNGGAAKCFHIIRVISGLNRLTQCSTSSAQNPTPALARRPSPLVDSDDETGSSLMVMARLFLRGSLQRCIATQIRLSSDQLGELGKGAGKGGGGGGSVRSAGGAFGKREVAEEEQYFRKKEKEQMEALRKHHSEEIENHKKEIERLKREIDRHQGKIRKLSHDD
ncbi:hypothetical protein CCH79_00008657 [Gambusia affinis]|uniref:ATPase inhibitor, mitochondrial n=2 Tax=Gambusia affinis TaxID=33528 RepID=A0A315UU32_GAMAF|nr:hypothetical protein CCH79_00008657 [Gambusia affinis]